MKKKIAVYSAFALLLSWLLFHLSFVHHALPIEESNRSQAYQEALIAPAIIDSLSDITRVPTLQSGIIKHIKVSVGEKVKKGQVLFVLDNSLSKNRVNIQKIVLEQTKNELLIQQKTLKHAEYQLHRLKKLDKRAISGAELNEKIHEVNMGRIQMTQAENHLSLAIANLKNAELDLNQFIIVAPKDGVVLQINAHKNEFVAATQPVILLGDAQKIMVRVSLDERDAQYFHPDAQAFMISHENPDLKIPLTFIQLDKYIVTLERLNSRVQEALYYFNRDDYPNLVAGQQFDASISIRTDAG